MTLPFLVASKPVRFGIWRLASAAVGECPRMGLGEVCVVMGLRLVLMHLEKPIIAWQTTFTWRDSPQRYSDIIARGPLLVPHS